MRSGIRAIHAIAAASNAFCSRIAQSKLRRGEFPRHAPLRTQLSSRVRNDFVAEGLARGIDRATQGFARIEIFEPAEIARADARSAGSDITASPTQLVARTRIRS